MKTGLNYVKWLNPGFILPKRDIGCIDMEDWPKHELRKMRISNLHYVTENMIVGDYNVERINGIEYLVAEESMIVDEEYLLGEDEINEMRVPSLPIWYTITPEQIYYLGLNPEIIEQQKLGEQSIENYRNELIESLEDAFWMDTRNRFFEKLLKDNEMGYSVRELNNDEIYELIEDILRDSTVKPEDVEAVISMFKSHYNLN